MSWEEASLRTHLIDSKLPEYSEAARREVESLRVCIETLQDKRTGPRSLQEAKFMLSQVQAQEERCKKAIETVRVCQPRSVEEEQSKRRLLSSLSVALDAHMGSLQQDIQQDSSSSPDFLQAAFHVSPSPSALAWEQSFRTELQSETSAIERSLAELKSVLSSAATTVKMQGEQLDRLDLNLSVVSENVGKGAVELENSERKQESSKNKLIWVFVLVFVVVVICVLVLILKKN